MPIKYDPLLASQMDGMKESNSIELPFPVIYTWVINGQSNQKQQGGAAYYGGFATKSEQVDQVLATVNKDLPTYFVPGTISLRDGSEYEGYTTRHVTLVPIAKRERWTIKPELGGGFGLHYNKTTGATSQHVQVLCYLADVIDKKFVPWGPVVVTAKGYQAKFLIAGFSQWDKFTAKLRSSVAPGIPYTAFWCSIGTFGERRPEMVGPTNSQSPITPVTIYIPENITEEKFEMLWVGNDVMRETIQLRHQAEEWLQAWSGEKPANQDIGAAISVPAEREPDDPFQGMPF